MYSYPPYYFLLISWLSPCLENIFISTIVLVFLLFLVGRGLFLLVPVATVFLINQYASFCDWPVFPIAPSPAHVVFKYSPVSGQPICTGSQEDAMWRRMETSMAGLGCPPPPLPSFCTPMDCISPFVQYTFLLSSELTFWHSVWRHLHLLASRLQIPNTWSDFQKSDFSYLFGLSDLRIMRSDVW